MSWDRSPDSRTSGNSLLEAFVPRSHLPPTVMDDSARDSSLITPTSEESWEESSQSSEVMEDGCGCGSLAGGRSSTTDADSLRFLSNDLNSGMWSVDPDTVVEHAFVRRVAVLGTSWLPPQLISTFALLAWRVAALVVLTSCGLWGTFVQGPDVHWGPSWHVENPPVVYLTNWAFFVVCTYLVLACCASYLAWRDDLDPNLSMSLAFPLFHRTGNPPASRSSSRANPRTDPANTPPHSQPVYSSPSPQQQQQQTSSMDNTTGAGGLASARGAHISIALSSQGAPASYDLGNGGNGSGGRAAGLAAMMQDSLGRGALACLDAAPALFAVALVAEPIIVIGFWGLVYPGSHDCTSPTCPTVHGGGLIVILSEAAINQLQLAGWAHLRWVLAFVWCWAGSQFAWVHSGYHHCYDVLTMRDSLSIWLCAGGTAAAAALFVAFRTLLEAKKAPSPNAGPAKSRNGQR